MSEQQVPVDARPIVPAPEGEPGGRRIGVYVCHCGGNISDYVDVEKVIDDIRDDGDVVVAKTAMFTCSDATQQEIVADIQANDLDGLVVASCSPKLHTYTFRGVAQRAGLNPYEYTQVNIREQCSWVHTDDHDGATAKATALVEGGHRAHPEHRARSSRWSSRPSRTPSSSAGGSRGCGRPSAWPTSACA